MHKVLKRGWGWLVVASYAALVLYFFVIFETHYLNAIAWEQRVFAYLLVGGVVVYSMDSLRRLLGLTSGERRMLEMRWRSFMEVTHAIFNAEGNKEALNQFVDLIQKDMKVAWVRVFLFREEKGRCIISTPNFWTDEIIDLSDELSRFLYAHRQPVDDEQVRTFIPSHAEASQRLSAWGASLVVGMFIQGKLSGVIFLGPRHQKQKYHAFEKMGLQVLVNQLAMVLEMKLLSAEFRQSNVYYMKLLEVLLDQLASGVIIVDPKGFVLVCNQEARRLMGWQEGNIPASWESLPQELGSALHQVLTQVFELQDNKVLIKIGDELELFIQFDCRRIEDEGGRILGAQLVFQDVSQVKQLEKQLHHANRLANLGALSASMVHEIKNPLVAIKTFVQLLPERINDEEFLQKFSHLIGNEVGRIDQIVSQLLHLARPSSSSFISFHLHEVIDTTLALYHPDLTHRKIKVIKDLKADEDLILGDRQKIQQILMNLVVNAEEAMKQGGVLSIQTKFVKRPSRLKDDEDKENELMQTYVCLTIRDTGHGMMPKVLKRVFEPFYSTKREGNGLGLSIVMGIMEDHQGSIEVQSELMQGTCFHLYFPLHSKATYA